MGVNGKSGDLVTKITKPKRDEILRRACVQQF